MFVINHFSEDGHLLDMIPNNRLLIAQCVFLAVIGCKREDSSKRSLTRRQVSIEETRLASKPLAALKSLDIEFNLKTWGSPIESDAKAWFWGKCSEEKFVALVKALGAKENSSVWSRWPGAVNAPPGESGWKLRDFPESGNFFVEDHAIRTVTYLVYKDGQFYIAITTD